jgi:hypothetical protein
MVLKDNGSETIYTYNYIDNFLGIRMIRDEEFTKLILRNTMLMMLCIMSLVFNKKNVLNYPRLRVIKKVGKILLFPTKAVIFIFLLLLAYGGKISVLSMIYRTALVLILIQIMRQAYSAKKIKINTSNYIRFLNILTFIYLLIFSIVVVLFYSVDQSESDKKSAHGIISIEADDTIRMIRTKYAEKISKVLL